MEIKPKVTVLLHQANEEMVGPGVGRVNDNSRCMYCGLQMRFWKPMEPCSARNENDRRQSPNQEG